MIRVFALFIPVCIAFFSATSVFAVSVKPANFFSVPTGTTGLTLISGHVTEVKHVLAKCGPTENCVNQTTVKVEFGLGCTDDLAVTSKSSFNPKTGKVVIDVTALELNNKNSLIARCIVQNRKVATIVVNSNLSNVKASDVSVNFVDKFSAVSP